MSFIDRLKHSLGFKASEARTLASMHTIGQPVTSPADYESFARKGYSYNAIVYTSISKITTAAKSVDWVLYQKGRGSKRNWVELENHPFIDLFHKPNPMQSQSDFIESVIGFKKIAGNSYIEANRPNPNRPPLEIWPVRPDKMRIVPGSLGYPLAFEFCYSGQKKSWPVDQVTLASDILHMKYFNPTNDWYGLSPIQSFLLSLDQYNHANRWNLALLQNEARPSGVLQMSVTKDNPRGALTDTQYQQLKQQVEERSGSWNAGRPLILQGGLEWKQMSLSPKDMDFLNAKNTTGNDILMAYGVPGELVGLGQKTFNNYAEARLSFYEETVLPTLDSLRDNLNNWLLPMFGDNLHIDYDEDSIPALVEKREQKYASLATVNYLTENEKREAIGYEPIPGFDVIKQGSFYYHVDEFAETNDLSTSRRQTDVQPPDEEQDELSTSNSSEELEFKSINLINSNEKRKSWQSQNRLRQRIERSFAKELEKDFNSLISKLSDSASKLNSSDKKLIEFALLNELDSWAGDNLDKTLRKNIESTLRIFARNIFRDAKSQGLVLQTKALNRFDDFVLRYVEQFTGTQISTIKNTNQKKIKKIVSEWVADSVQEGSTLPELSRYLEMEFEGLSKTNSMRIARTEVAVASNAGLRGAAKELEIPNMKKEWIAATDDRTRTEHQVMNGERVGLDEKFLVPADGAPDEMDGPGDTSATPANFINCFHPDTVLSGYFVIGASFQYSGNIFNISSKSGKVISVTPNHPIMTTNGMVFAKDIQVGDKLFSERSFIQENSGFIGKENNHNKPATAKQIFESLRLFSSGLKGVADDFYGDFAFGNGDINIVSMNSELLNRVKFFRDQGEDFLLKLKDSKLSLLESISSFDLSLDGVSGPSPSRPSRFKLPFDKDGILLDRLPLKGLLLGMTPELDSAFFEIASNASSATTADFTDMVNRHSAVIHIDDVKSVDYCHYDGPVYDFQTNTNLISSNGIVTSNCRCVLTFSGGN